jgi:voltage-gated potassium channel
VKQGHPPFGQRRDAVALINPERKRLTKWYERLTLWRAIRLILLIAISLMTIGAVLARLVEPEEFTSIGLAYWWAVTTVTTVGYGDVVPKDTAGRVVGTMLMLTGLSLIPLITSVVVSALVSKRAETQRDFDRQLYAEQSARLERIEQQLAELAARPPADASPPPAPAAELPPRESPS